MKSHFAAWIMHMKNPSLRASFAISFCILFALIGRGELRASTATLRHGAMRLGFVYFVLLPSIATSPLAGRCCGAVRDDASDLLGSALGVVALSLPLLLSSLAAVLAGIVLVGCRASASGLRQSRGLHWTAARRASRWRSNSALFYGLSW